MGPEQRVRRMNVHECLPGWLLPLPWSVMDHWSTHDICRNITSLLDNREKMLSLAWYEKFEKSHFCGLSLHLCISQSRLTHSLIYVTSTIGSNICLHKTPSKSLQYLSFILWKDYYLYAYYWVLEARWLGPQVTMNKALSSSLIQYKTGVVLTCVGHKSRSH